MITPTDLQIQVAREQSARLAYGELVARHLTSSGLLINEHKRVLIAVSPDGTVVRDKRITIRR